MKKIKFTAALCAVLLSASMLSGCGTDGENKTSETGSSAQSSEAVVSTAVELDGDGLNGEAITTRPIEEGDDYAINKINPKSAEDALPGGYKLADYSEKDQGKFYTNGKSKIVIYAYNYKEDLQELATWADKACAMMLIQNITKACDTVYGEPENAKVCGFDSIKYDYEIIQYEFVDETTKSEIGRYKARVYYFYSEQDAYIIQFDTAEADWEEQSANFEAFVADLEITKTEY
ncbi:MAG: hypothetical protein ACI4KG_06260 [Oscillospiraceae bacterium]